jgi:hypothetical protein
MPQLATMFRSNPNQNGLGCFTTKKRFADFTGIRLTPMEPKAQAVTDDQARDSPVQKVSSCQIA